MATRRCFGLVLGVLAVLRTDIALFACSVCFRIEDGPTVSGVRAAVVVLITVTLGVLVPCAVFVARFARRARTTSTPDLPPTS